MSTTKDPKPMIVVAALLPEEELQRLSRRFGQMNISVRKLASWDEAIELHPEMTLVTSSAMLLQRPDPRIMDRRSRLLVLINGQEKPGDILHTAAAFLQQPADLMLMGVNAPFVLPLAVQSQSPDHNLVDRELQVLRGMVRGMTNKMIGDDLNLSEDTIKTHARRLFRKLGARDRAQAVAIGFRRGIVR